jgi:hypothetical protein
MNSIVADFMPQREVRAIMMRDCDQSRPRGAARRFDPQLLESRQRLAVRPATHIDDCASLACTAPMFGTWCILGLSLSWRITSLHNCRSTRLSSYKFVLPPTHKSRCPCPLDHILTRERPHCTYSSPKDPVAPPCHLTTPQIHHWVETGETAVEPARPSRPSAPYSARSSPSAHTPHTPHTPPRATARPIPFGTSATTPNTGAPAPALTETPIR